MERTMMHSKSSRTGTADMSEFSGFVSTKQSGIISITKVVILISVLLAVLMVVSK